MSRYTLGNGQVITRAYDANYRLTDLTSPAFNLHVARDAMGNLTAIGNSPGASPATESYRYDALDRLTAITEADGSTLESVAYNKTGDRLGKSGSGQAVGTYSYNPGTHQLIATGNAVRAVDANGNTTAISQAGATYGLGYNDRNRLAVAQLAGSTVGSYTYNALGERIQKVAGTASERYGYDEGQRLLSEQGATNRDYVWMDGIPVANVDTSGVTSTIAYVTADHLGTPRAVSSSSGTTVWQWPYQGNTWGELAPTSAGYAYNSRFPGQYYDQESGLTDNGARPYEAATGHFLQPDPSGINGGLGLYVYGLNNPLFYFDPDGLQAQPAPGQQPFYPSPAPPAGGVPDFGPPANESLPIEVPAIGGLCLRILGGIGAMLYSSPTSACDQPYPPAENNCPGNDDRCAKAKAEAQSAYWKLMTKRIPQFQTGGTRGRDPNHLTSILQLQSRLRDAIRRVLLYCKPAPSELDEWERAANLNAPGF